MPSFDRDPTRTEFYNDTVELDYERDDDGTLSIVFRTQVVIYPGDRIVLTPTGTVGVYDQDSDD